MPPVTVPVEPTFTYPKFPAPDLLIIMVPPVMLKVAPTSSILKGAAPAVVEPTVFKVRVPLVILKNESVGVPALSNLLAILILPPLKVTTPP